MKLMIDSKELLMASQDHSPTGRASRAFTLVELLVVIVIIGILGALLLAFLGRTTAKAQNAVCVNHLRQLGSAARSYAKDNNNRLPSAERLPTQPANPQEPLPRICDLLARRIGQIAGTNADPGSVFKCPGDNAGLFAAEGSSYEWNADVNGHGIDEPPRRVLEGGSIHLPGGQIIKRGPFVRIIAPDTIPLLLDYRDFHPGTGKSGKNAVFMDGHVAPQ
jgi:prepilin-type N-terminal cleavage/methylation domain-containing protein/prepilin-type processing-associated H-X9-DG protein